MRSTSIKSEPDYDEDKATIGPPSLSLGGLAELLGALAITVKKAESKQKKEGKLTAKKVAALADEAENRDRLHDKLKDRHTKLQSRYAEAELDLAMIRAGRMCPVCGAKSYRTKNKLFTEGNQIIAHIRGMKDEAHTLYRQGTGGTAKKDCVSC